MQYVELARSTRAILEAKVPAGGAIAIGYRVVWLTSEGFAHGAISFDHGTGAAGLERAIHTYRTGSSGTAGGPSR